MSKYYIAPTRKGRLLKIVEDVKVPVSDKLQKLGRMEHDYIVKQRLVARFVNEDEAREWLDAYSWVVERRKELEKRSEEYKKAFRMLREAQAKEWDMLRSE